MIEFIEHLEGTNWENDAIISRKVNEIIKYLNNKENNEQEKYISKDEIRKVIKKYYDDYEEQKRYRYTRDVEEEQSVLKDIEKELLGE